MLEEIRLTRESFGTNGTVSIVIDFDIDKISNALGVNYTFDSNGNTVMYVGTNSNNGLVWETDTNNNLYIYPYVNGEKITQKIQSLRCVYSDCRFFYKKTDKSIVFGYGQSKNICAAIGKGVDQTNGKELYGYVFSKLNNNSGFISKEHSILSEDGTFEQKYAFSIYGSDSNFYSNKILSLAPAFIESKNVIMKHIYYPITYEKTTECREITMNGKEYVMANACNNGSTRFVAEM